MASNPLWFFTPLQIAITTVAGVNAGASALQSPLTWPMLQDADVPPHYTGRQTEQLLHGSEHIFPPLNAFCTLGNLVMTGFAYFHPAAPGSDKISLTALAAALHVGTTVYTLGIMAPYNRRLAALSKEMNRGVEKAEAETEGQKSAVKAYRDAQTSWKKLNYVRGIIMIGATAASAIALSMSKV